MRNLGALILTHGRPDRVVTDRFLRSGGYTGPIIYVIDDEDETADRYIARYGRESIEIFDKRAMAARIDCGNNFDNRKVIVHARNASFDIATARGLTHFVQLDDDYTGFLYRNEFEGRTIRRLDDVFNATLDFLDDSQAMTIAWSQGGDHMGGFAGLGLWRKAMNSFFCRTDRRFWFLGSINEDVNTYVTAGARGGLMFTFTGLQLNQVATQQGAGGMTDIYLRHGTYVKSFSTVLFAPSAVRVSMMGRKFKRLHHAVDWAATTACIVPESFRRLEPAPGLSPTVLGPSEASAYNARLARAGFPDLYVRALADGSWAIERRIPDAAPFDAEPELVGSGDSLEAAYRDAVGVLSLLGPFDDGGSSASTPAASATGHGATVSSQGPETEPAGPRFAPPTHPAHLPEPPAARGFDQAELFA